MTTLNTIQDFVRENRITMTAERAAANPNMTDGAAMDHWRVKFTRRNDGGERSGLVAAKMTTYFSMGYGHNGAAPTVEDVLDCLASDATCSDSFEDFCLEYGYDSDSRKAEKTWKACIKSRDRLQQFLGGDLFTALVYDTERC